MVPQKWRKWQKDLVHVLSMAGINDGNGVSFYRIGKVPLVGVCHVITSPSGNCRLTSGKVLFYTINRQHCIFHISFQIVLIICMTVFFRYILVEREDFARCARPDNVFHISQLRKCHRSPWL